MSLGFTALAVAQTDSLTEDSSVVVAVLMTATMTAIVAITITTMLRFTLHRSKPWSQRIDLIVAWKPLFLLDLVILEILVGLLVWYTSNFTERLATCLGIELLVLMGLMVLVAVWVWREIKTLIFLCHFNNVDTDNVVYCRQSHK
jgi:hypothetical protein